MLGETRVLSKDYLVNLMQNKPADADVVEYLWGHIDQAIKTRSAVEYNQAELSKAEQTYRDKTKQINNQLNDLWGKCDHYYVGGQCRICCYHYRHKEIAVMIDGFPAMIDEGIAPLIRDLNAKGFKTSYCCQGSLSLNEMFYLNRIFPAYIKFAQEFSQEIIEKGQSYGLKMWDNLIYAIDSDDDGAIVEANKEFEGRVRQVFDL